MHQGFTHTILLGLGITATLHALLRLQDNNNPGDYLYLGIAISIGVLAKYSFLLFLIPLLTAALSIELFRKLILHRHITLAIVTVTIATTPHLYWLSQHYQELFPVIDQKLQVTSANSMTEKISGLYHFSLSAMAFVTPWILLIGALTFQQFSLSPARSPATQLLSRFYLILLVGMITAALFITMPHFKVRWFHPLMMLFPLWWLSMTESSSPLSKTRWDWVLRITAAMTLLIIAIRLLQVITGPDLGHYSRLNRPIMETLQQLPLPPRDTLLVTQDEFLGAHLLSFYPENSVAIGATLYDRGKKLSGSCWLLHDNDDSFPSANWLGTTPLKPYVTTVGKVQYRLELGQQPPVECNTIIQPLQISD